MSQEEIMRALRSDAKHSKLANAADHVLLYEFVMHLLENFVSMTDHANFPAVKIKQYMLDAIVGNIMMNSQLLHTLKDVELIVSGSALMIGVIQLNDYMEEQKKEKGGTKDATG